MHPTDKPSLGETRGNRHWPHRGGTLSDLSKSDPETLPLTAPAPGEIVARVEAASICSSDLKIMHMGGDHPLFQDGEIETVLGHEMCLRVVSVGEDRTGRFRPGQRLGLQPAMRIDGARRIVGMHLPGGFAQYIRLGGEVIDGDYLFDLPEAPSAAELALLEPYGCVERAWAPNARRELKSGGRALVVCGPGAARFRLPDVPAWLEVTLIGEMPDWLESQPRRLGAISELDGGTFDDILALGEIGAEILSKLVERMNRGGVLLIGRSGDTAGPVGIDPARVHYDMLSFLGTIADDLSTALRPERQRFDVRPGGAALVFGAGGAMGRMHVHRLLQLKDGPALVIATTRKGARLKAIREDFEPLARAAGRRLEVFEPDAIAEACAALAPRGLDDATVVAPDPDAVARVATLMADDGLLSVFAGFPFGRRVPIQLSKVATGSFRLTGSTGCTVEDMRGVLRRVEAGELSLLHNLKAVAGLDALPQAMRAVTDGAVSGKIAIFPHAPDMGLTILEDRWTAAREVGLTG
ncbi:D-arabinose 1-dehydrogenase-like Zn-dependent alcohol dehydrogenase [Palleronia aestuarii]|uniref:D-arabinose 1-dehydrogenase-like Zn-dependent alcohol dehydrogenase n=1 Tax=Palleronia aestuarii TaxID=568105 RepID=A0A2W7MXD6_9RHOB|nr:alcohol dehydrogenase catalytic domain-containing protein [Palleronia aestuarii]PZX12193.1 D-arabinose 1-dehydrogenase-like Zn-dependent alcohol dehydrogenase [Palleronia aestuarii]